MKKQIKSHVSSPLPVLDAKANTIRIPACELTCGQAVKFRDVLSRLLLSCNVAKYCPTFSLQTMWDTLNDTFNQTIDIDSKTLADFQRLAKIGDSLESSVLELIQYYEGDKGLNLIFHSDVLEKRTSYTSFTSQFAHSISRSQIFYPYVKVLFDPTTSRLGVFCRKSKFDSQSFIKGFTKQLIQHRAIIMSDEELPQTYKSNFAMLNQHLKKELPDSQNFNVTKLTDSILIELRD